MYVVPAIDLKAGKVVRAVAGQRNNYRPLESRVTDSADPEAVGRALADRMSCRVAYVADLDAIGGEEPAWDTFVSLIGCGLSLWIDAGLADKARVDRMVEFADDHKEVAGVIAGLESLPGEDVLAYCLERVGADRFIFGLDLKDGRPMTEAPEWREMIAPEVVDSVIAAGAQKVLLVDLAAVGMHGGCATDKLCRHLHRLYPQVEFFAGGGIRHVDDLHSLARHGCSVALASSAMHDGWITKEDLAEFNEA